jgi:hypothetical protein
MRSIHILSCGNWYGQHHHTELKNALLVTGRLRCTPDYNEPVYDAAAYSRHSTPICQGAIAKGAYGLEAAT